MIDRDDVDTAEPDRRTSPTIVVARTPRPGHEREFERWLNRISTAASEAPGYVSSEVQAPTDAHPDDWVIVYRFDTIGSLRDWLGSDRRMALLTEGEGLIAGEVREQLVALPERRDPVTAVASFRVLPGHEASAKGRYQRITAAMAAYPGFMRSELLPPGPGVQEDTVVVFTFDGRDRLDAWLESDERARLLDELLADTDGDRTLNVVGGFAGWFGTAGTSPVKRWKQAALVLLALYPTSLLLTKVRGWVLPDVHWVFGVLFANVLGIIALTWVLMPFLTSRLARWLER